MLDIISNLGLGFGVVFQIVWLKLKSLAEGAAIVSDRMKVAA